ncbi:MAG: sterol desaturase family protein [Polyangiaceae bacterium]
MKQVLLDNLLSLGVGLVVLVFVFVPLERLFAARKQPFLRPEFRIDLTFLAGQYLVFATVVSLGLRALYDRTLAFEPLAPLQAQVSSLPIWTQALLAAAIGDFLIYWFHRACHHFDVLWRFHAVHHSVEHLDWLAAHREHPLDGIFTQLFLNLPGILLGVDFRALGALIVFRGMWAIFIHSNVRMNVGPLRWVFGAPELHHWHHARVRYTAHNFANLGPYWDLVFGTYHRPVSREETYPLGLEPDETLGVWPRGYVAQLLRPFVGRTLAERVLRWVEPPSLARSPAE